MAAETPKPSARLPGGWPAAWWQRLSLRARITVLATAIFTLALLLAGVALLFTVGKSLLGTLDSSASRTGTEVAGLVLAGKLPDQVLANTGQVALIQVVDARDRVLSHTPGTADALVSMLRPAELARARSGHPVNVSGDRAGTDDQLRVVAVKADTPTGERTVLVATDLGRVLDSSRLLQRYLILGAPVAIMVLAGLTWSVVGLTLRPVAALRRGANELSAAGLSRSRLPVPSARDEIHSLATTLNTMLDRLDTATTKQRQFVGDAAHELRSPIASLRLQLEIAGRLSESAELRELTDEALIDVRRLSVLIDDLLALARSDEQRGQRLFVPIRLDELVLSVLRQYRETSVSVTTTELAEVTVTGDPSGMRRVLVNLIDNAVRYAKVSVSVSVVERANTAVLRVDDDGPGVPASKRERVFDRFYRLDSSRARADGGSGLGLAIVRDIIDSHGGSVLLQDNEPGLRAEVTLPLAP